MADLIQIAHFLSLTDAYPIIDVRSPSEFSQGHIPGAFNVPLFDDQERKVVGTTYKQVNKEAAMYAGLAYAGKKLVGLAKEGEKKAGRKKTLLVHCWRGGMRSKSMVWLFETIGLTCHLLEGGYKSYRRFIHEEFDNPIDLNVIGGRTGSGKTQILHHFEKEGEQIIDLEGLANHKGSAFGALGEEPQPTTEQFENNLGEKMRKLDRRSSVWIEDESRNVGKCVVPGELYRRMRESKLVFLDIPREKRAHHLVSDYAQYDSDSLKSCILKIQKKLGGDRSREALEAIESGNFFHAAMLSLHYYDKAYMHSLDNNHDRYQVIPSDDVDPVKNMILLKKHFQ